MGPSIPLFLTRLAGLFVAGMLLFAVFSHAHAKVRTTITASNVFPATITMRCRGA